MKMKLLIAAAALSGFLATPALADTCEDLVDQVDGLIAEQGAGVSSESMVQIVDLRNGGSDDCANGDEVEGIAKLETAISLFTQ